MCSSFLDRRSHIEDVIDGAVSVVERETVPDMIYLSGEECAVRIQRAPETKKRGGSLFEPILV